MGLIKAIHHISMKTCTAGEYRKVIDFYTNVLGLSVAREWDAGIMFSAGDAVIEIFNNGKESMDMGVIRHFAFAVDDVDACVAAVRNAGYKITMEPTDIVIQSQPPIPARIAFCIGAAGEEIEFFHEK